MPVHAVTAREGVRGPPARSPGATRDGNHAPIPETGHYWEIGFRGFSLAKITSLIERHFTVVDRYHNDDWKYSYNFVLTARD